MDEIKEFIGLTFEEFNKGILEEFKNEKIIFSINKYSFITCSNCFTSRKRSKQTT